MMSKKMTVMMLVLSVAGAGACSGKPETGGDQATAQPSGSAQPAAVQQPTGTFTGRVAETMDAGTYTYVRVEADGREIWAAATKFDVSVGDEVVVPLEMEMRDFHSDTLDRDFPLIYFASTIAPAGGAAAPVMPPGHPPVSGAAAAHETGAEQPAAVEPASDGLTIAEIWAGKDGLAGSTVTLRGRVAKFNGGILGTNWMHLQDGSGDPATGTHDITVTSPATASVGDIVTVTGPVVVDQDFGAGYSYPVMIKDATVVLK